MRNLFLTSFITCLLLPIMSFAQEDPSKGDPIPKAFAQLLRKFELQLGQSALNPTLSLRPSVNLNLEGAIAVHNFNENSAIMVVPYVVRLQYQLQPQDQNQDGKILIEEFSAHLLQYIRTLGKGSKTEFEIAVKIAGFRYEDYSFGATDDPRFRDDVIFTELLVVRPKLTIYLDQASREIFFEIRGLANLGKNAEGIRDREDFFYGDAEAVQAFNERGGLGHATVMFGGGGGVGFRGGLGFALQMKRLMISYDYRKNTFEDSSITVTDYSTPDYHRDFNTYEKYSTNEFNLSFRIGGRTELTAKTVLLGDGSRVYTGAGLKIDLSRKKRRKK